MVEDQPTNTTDDRVAEARGIALNEDWIATIVGLAIVLLAAAGVIGEGWLPL